MPWKGEKDPYRIWLSEIILQQTRVEQGLPYYLRFVKEFPDLQTLAAADDQQVFRLWQGLGYYQRCRNMLATARQLVQEHEARFPESYEGLLKLKGVGEYTAAAIASFAFQLPQAVVDGNVVRVLSRLFRMPNNGTDAAGKTLYRKLAQDLLPTQDPAGFNQAMMDLGATLCKPGIPECAQCPLSTHCSAFRQGDVQLFPPPKPRKELQTRYFHFIIPGGAVLYLVQRKEKDIWQDLFMPYYIESDSAQIPAGMSKNANPVEVQEQVLSHRRIHATFYRVRTWKPPRGSDIIPVERKHLKHYAFPRVIVSFFKKFNYL